MYERINPIPPSLNVSASAELNALAQIWRERRQELEHTGIYQEFLKRLQREWAIETGIIERLYSWDRGVTQVLIEQGIDAALIAHRGGLDRSEADHVKNLIDDQLTTVEGLFAFVKGQQPLTEHFIRSMHAQLTAHQDYTDAVTSDGKPTKVALLKGEYKKQQNNPKRPDGEIHHYCPHEIVNEEMENLIRMYREFEGKFSPEILSAWLHHRFTQIHPFQDGNGRVARALASLVFLKAGLFPLVIRDQDRNEYIAALEAADAGDLSKLVLIFAKRQRDAILGALGLEKQAQQSRYADEIIQSAIQVLKNRFAAETAKVHKVYDAAENLRKITFNRFEKLVVQLDKQLISVTPRKHDKYHARSQETDNKSKERYYFYNQIIEIAKKFDYFANVDQYRTWARLSIFTEQLFEFVVSFHGYGHGETGVMVASAFTAQRVLREEGKTEPINTVPASPDLFQFNYVESPESIEKRYSEWLETTIAIALAEWRRSLGT